MGSIGAKSKFNELSIVDVDRDDEDDNPFIDIIELVLSIFFCLFLLFLLCLLNFWWGTQWTFDGLVFTLTRNHIFSVKICSHLWPSIIFCVMGKNYLSKFAC